MKSLFIFMAFTSGALASAIQLPNLMDRAIDPATMNPTLFSVLSVLKTGMPTGPNIPMPTGDFEPDWYQKLPGDVKSLLPSFYPVAAAATTFEAQVVSQVSAVESSVAMAQSEGVSSTDTVVYASTATDAVLASSSVSASDSASPTTSSATLASASATPSSSLSTGARFAVKTETMAVVAWLSVGAGFFIFA